MHQPQRHHPGTPHPWRRRVYAALNPHTPVVVFDADASAGPYAESAGAADSALLASLVEAALIAVILVNSAALILWTVPRFQDAYSFWFHIIEYCTVAVFLAEYGLRVWAAPEANPGVNPWRQRWRYLRSPAALVDAAALAPSAFAAVELLITGGGVNLSFLLSVRLLTRSVKLARYFPSGRRLAIVLRQKSGQLSVTVAGLLFVLVIAASLMYFAESAAQPEVFSSIPAAMWWSVVTLTTVGYGDTVPVTIAGRILAGVIAVLGIGLFALPAGILSAGLLESGASDRPPANTGPNADGRFCPHCGQPLPDDSDADG